VGEQLPSSKVFTPLTKEIQESRTEFKKAHILRWLAAAV
jgi:hypothetical protein